MLTLKGAEGELQSSLYELCKLCVDYNFKISLRKTRITHNLLKNSNWQKRSPVRVSL